MERGQHRDFEDAAMKEAAKLRRPPFELRNWRGYQEKYQIAPIAIASKTTTIPPIFMVESKTASSVSVTGLLCTVMGTSITAGGKAARSHASRLKSHTPAAL